MAAPHLHLPQSSPSRHQHQKPCSWLPRKRIGTTAHDRPPLLLGSSRAPLAQPIALPPHAADAPTFCCTPHALLASLAPLQPSVPRTRVVDALVLRSGLPPPQVLYAPSLSPAVSLPYCLAKTVYSSLSSHRSPGLHG